MACCSTEQLQTDNIHLMRMRQFYLKKSEVDVTMCAKATLKAQTTLAPVTANTIEFDWNCGGRKTLFTIAEDMTLEDTTKLHNVSFVHSLLYVVNAPLYFTGMTIHKRADCEQFIEKIRTDVCAKKMTKEIKGVAHNLQAHVYTDATVQYIVNFIGRYHVILLSNTVAQAPKLFAVTKEGVAKNYLAASDGLLFIYFDNHREIYYPVYYCQAHQEHQLHIAATAPDFVRFLTAAFCWGKPSEAKKWAVADLRAFITFFDLPIDITLDKKSIAEQVTQHVGLFF